MNKVAPYLVAVLALGVIVLWMVGEGQRRAASEWKVRADSAYARAGREIARADSAVEKADALEEVSRFHKQRADTIYRTAIQKVIEVRSVVAPDTCAPFIAARDSIINDLIDANIEHSAAVEDAYAANDLLRVANTTLHATADSLMSVIKAAPKPKPRIGLGVFGGYCINGRPCAGIGVTWRIF